METNSSSSITFTRKESNGDTFILATDADENLKVFVNASVEQVISDGFRVFRICTSSSAAEKAKRDYYKDKVRYVAIQMPNGETKTKSWLNSKKYPINTMGVFKSSVEARAFASKNSRRKLA